MAVMSEIIWNIIVLWTVLNLQPSLDHIVIMNLIVVILHCLIRAYVTPTNAILYTLFILSFA
jgi:hypothetical protein